MESNTDNVYQDVYITFKLDAESNQLLSESAKRSNRKKIQEAILRLSHHLRSVRSISDIENVVHEKGKGFSSTIAKKLK